MSRSPGLTGHRLLEQHVALTHDAVELEAQRVVLRCKCNQGVVEKATAFGRRALHDHEVVGREDADTRTTPSRSRARVESLAVDLHAVATVARLSSASISTSRGRRRERSPDDRACRRRRGSSPRAARRGMLDSVARYASASARLVLPCPLSPSTAVTPAVSSNVAASSCGSRPARAVRRSRLDHARVTSRAPGRASRGRGSRRGRRRGAPPASSGRASTT